IVLDNLLDNAIKYAPAGSEVRLSIDKGVGAHVRMAVSDAGPGVPEDLREHVFDKFCRVEHRRPRAGREPRGSGIGLYLCRELVELHGGSIRCELPDHGTGSRFAIEPPIWTARHVQLSA